MTQKWTRRSALALMGSGGALFALGSAGFTDVTSNRETNVTAVSDRDALLGIVGDGDQILDTTTFDSGFTVILTNRTNAPIPAGELDVRLDPFADLVIEDGDGDVAFQGASGTFTNDGELPVGEEARLHVTNQSCEQDLAVEVTAQNEVGTSIDLNRTTTIDAPAAPEPDPAVADFWWPIDEGEGETIADSRGGQDGTRQGGGPAWRCGRWVGGWALDGDGEDDFVDTGDWSEAGFDLNDEFAIAYTIDSTDPSDYATVMSAREGSDTENEGFDVTFSHGWEEIGLYRGASFRICDGENDAAVYTDDNEADDPPHRFLINKRNSADPENPHDPAAWEIYKDGVKLQNLNILDNGLDADLPDVPTETRFFDWEGSEQNRTLEGSLDDVIVFSRPLDDSEVREDFERQPWAELVDFEVDITGTNDPVVEGETVVVDVTVENVDETADTQTIGLFYDENGDGSVATLTDTEDVTLEAGDSTTITLEWDTVAGDAGDNIPVRVTSHTHEDTETVTVLDGTDFVVSEFEAPETAFRGRSIDVSATITNDGETGGTQTISYQFDGEIEATTEVELDTGEETTVQFEFEIPDTLEFGEYTHGIHSEDDSETATIEIESMAGSIDRETATQEAFRTGTGQGQHGVGFRLRGEDNATGTIEVEAVGVPFAQRNNGDPAGIVRAKEEDDGEFVEISDESQSPDLIQVYVDLDGDSIEIGSDPVETAEINVNPLAVDGADDEGVLVALQRFRDDNGSELNMNNGDVDIVLVFGDGSQITLEIRDLP